MPMGLIRVCIAGGRDFNDYAQLCDGMNAVKAAHYNQTIEVISGAARGADRLGEKWGADQGLVVRSFPPDYENNHPKQAPFIRNAEMAEEADVLVAFWDGKSRGTRHMIGCAFKQGLEIHIYRYG